MSPINRAPQNFLQQLRLIRNYQAEMRLAKIKVKTAQAPVAVGVKVRKEKKL